MVGGAESFLSLLLPFFFLFLESLVYATTCLYSQYCSYSSGKKLAKQFFSDVLFMTFVCKVWIKSLVRLPFK